MLPITPPGKALPPGLWYKCKSLRCSHRRLLVRIQYCYLTKGVKPLLRQASWFSSSSAIIPCGNQTFRSAQSASLEVSLVDRHCSYSENSFHTVWAGKVAPWVKCQPCKHDKLSLDSQCPHENQLWRCLPVSLIHGEQEGFQMLVSGPCERLCLKKRWG